MEAKCLYSIYLDGVLYAPGSLIKLTQEQLKAYQGFVEVLKPKVAESPKVAELPKPEVPKPAELDAPKRVPKSSK